MGSFPAEERSCIMEIRLRDWINRPDFSKIVEAVPCPLMGCRGVIGVPCYNLHSVPGTLAYNRPRAEYHSERIYSGVTTYVIAQQAAEAASTEVIPDASAKNGEASGDNA